MSSSGFVSQSHPSRSTSREIDTFQTLELCKFIDKSVNMTEEGLTACESSNSSSNNASCFGAINAHVSETAGLLNIAMH